ncbi:MAG: XRE family transcriptional regulator [Clostridia bacterium]|nr:XRE family transcriptional regulator [Clostridia bacterium]
MFTKLEVGNVLRSMRVSSGYSQSELGKMIGKTQQTLARWEQGENQPDITTLFRICELCGTTVQDAFHLPASLVGEIERGQEIGEEARSATLRHAEKVLEDEEHLIGLYRELNPEGQEKLVEYADDMVQSRKYIKSDPAFLVEKA